MTSEGSEAARQRGRQVASVREVSAGRLSYSCGLLSPWQLGGRAAEQSRAEQSRARVAAGRAGASPSLETRRAVRGADAGCRRRVHGLVGRDAISRRA